MNLADMLDAAADYEIDPINVRVYLANRLDEYGKQMMEGKVRLDEIGEARLVDDYQELHLIPVELSGKNENYTIASFARVAEMEPALKSYKLMARTFESKRLGSDRVDYKAMPIVGSVCDKQEDGTKNIWLLVFPLEQWDYILKT